MYSKTINDTVFVAYSLGNFLSNQYWRYTDAGVILKLIHYRKIITKNTTCSFKDANYLCQLGFIEAMEVKKCIFYFQLEWASDSTKLPQFFECNLTNKKC
jgi:hypothetical protein